MTGLYSFAGKQVAVDSLYKDIHDLCADYRVFGKPDFTVSTTRQDIAFERERFQQKRQKEDYFFDRLSDGYLETLAVYRQIAEQMPSNDTVLFHGSAIAVDDQGYLFTAKSGTGKSTHARLWRKLLGERAIMINDDKPLIRVTEVGATVFGTPWDGKHHLSRNIAVPLRAICLLERAEENSICAISPHQAYAALMAQAYRPVGASALAKTLVLLDRLTESVGLYRLHCNMELEAAEISYRMMKG